MTELKLLTAKQVAAFLQVSLQQGYALIAKLPPGVAVRLGRSVRVNEAAFTDWLRAGGHMAEADNGC